ncbi:DUF4256 domain-containing protein [Brumimicrobium oceani]|uniref:DUF4256 domain-containing protein n=1 Tax=Brumimicrobium oceani TaxID=2100725 RepID=A0A2U2XB02_9FLAO|nr:DUF4256 domain-containing protein [Brumimicrobium oceani]PWH84943.1 DUF4256 domain-containing protein [Brumimicrobium oceani]
MSQTLTSRESDALLKTLKERFEENVNRHESLKWEDVFEKLKAQPEKLWSLHRMEETGGEPDVVDYDSTTDTYTFYDCSAESPKGRRSLCYDKQALLSNPKARPKNNIVDVAEEMGIEILDNIQYRQLQELGIFDAKSSSWLKTPDRIRSLGGAIFGDYRYDEVFIYHNSAISYYVSRGFRGLLKL